MLVDETGGEERRRKGCSESRWWCVHPVYIVWPEWKKGAPYFASAFSLLAVCNDVSKEGQRKRAQAVSSVRCRAFHSLISRRASVPSVRVFCAFDEYRE